MTEVLVTGGAGFIGSHLVDNLLADGRFHVTCLDSFDDFYRPETKRDNLRPHAANPRFTLVEADVRDVDTLRKLLDRSYHTVVHLAAKAGVRPSLLNPYLFQQVNLLGTQNILELSRSWGTEQFIFASSSSVYGISPQVPWVESANVLQPISPYAVSKVASELLGHVYSHAYGVRFIALRFFTVYGPRQRPDLAIHKFTNSILRGEKIQVFGDGSTRRDYTYVGDIVRGILSAMEYRRSMYEIINLGSHLPVGIMELIRQLERTLQRKATVEFLPGQPGDVPQTYADISKAKALLGYQPTTSLETGLEEFCQWFRSDVNAHHYG